MTSYVYIPFDNYRATINAAHKCLLCMTKVNCLIVIIQCTKITHILPVCFDGVMSRLKVGICLCCRVTCFLRSLLLKLFGSGLGIFEGHRGASTYINWKRCFKMNWVNSDSHHVGVAGNSGVWRLVMRSAS